MESTDTSGILCGFKQDFSFVDAQTSDDLPRIYALIAKAVATSDSDEFEQIMTELRAVLKEHIQRIRALAAAKLSSSDSEK